MVAFSFSMFLFVCLLLLFLGVWMSFLFLEGKVFFLKKKAKQKQKLARPSPNRLASMSVSQKVESHRSSMTELSGKMGQKMCTVALSRIDAFFWSSKNRLHGPMDNDHF